MQNPPPFHGSPPRKTNTALIVGIILGGVGLCCAGVIGLGGFGIFTVFKQAGPVVECAIGFEGVRDGIVMYAKEHGDKLPVAANWEDLVRPYYAKALPGKKDDLGPFKAMSVDGPWGCRLPDNAMTGMAYNSDVAGKAVKDVADSTVIVFEVPTAGRNLSMPFKKQDPSTSPKIFGKPRGWWTASLEGDPDIDSPDGSKGVKFNID